MQGLEKFLVRGTDEAYYVQNLVTEEEEAYLIRKVRFHVSQQSRSDYKIHSTQLLLVHLILVIVNTDRVKQICDSPHQKWKVLPNRR